MWLNLYKLGLIMIVLVLSALLIFKLKLQTISDADVKSKSLFKEIYWFELKLKNRLLFKSRMLFACKFEVIYKGLVISTL